MEDKRERISEEQQVKKEILFLRADTPNSTLPRPFLRWAGSKRFLLKYIIDALPTSFGTYREPFLGSGALFFLLQPKQAYLSDKCGELIETFKALRDDVRVVECHLSRLSPDKDTFYHVREHRSDNRFKRAAEFIYLNKTCWNGLYRVNLSGKFNVPFGRHKTPFTVDSDNLLACSESLRPPSVNIQICDFTENIESATKGDLVYFDPPYVTGHNNNGFVEYNEVIFSWQDQKRLAKVANDLVNRGVSVIVSNANHQPIIDLYKNFKVVTFSRNSTLASDIKRRRTISEVLLFSHAQTK